MIDKRTHAELNEESAHALNILRHALKGDRAAAEWLLGHWDVLEQIIVRGCRGTEHDGN